MSAQETWSVGLGHAGSVDLDLDQGKPTCHDRVVEVLRGWVQVDHLGGAVEGPAVLDHGGAVGALGGEFPTLAC